MYFLVFTQMLLSNSFFTQPRLQMEMRRPPAYLQATKKANTGMDILDAKTDSHSFNKDIEGQKYHVITVFGSVKIKAPYSEVLKFIQTIENLESYEPKLLKVAHMQKQQDSDQGFYISSGLFLFVPFHDVFSYELRADGFHSKMETGLLKNHMNGGFKLKKCSDSETLVYHYEVYELDSWKNIFSKLIERYLLREMQKELKNIKYECLQQKSHQDA